MKDDDLDGIDNEALWELHIECCDAYAIMQDARDEWKGKQEHYDEGIVADLTLQSVKLGQAKYLTEALMISSYKVRGKKVQSLMGIKTKWIVCTCDEWHMVNAEAIIEGAREAVTKASSTIASLGEEEEMVWGDRRR